MSGLSRFHGAKNGNSNKPGSAAANVIRKYVGQPVDSATPPKGATTMSRLADIKLDNNANCVAEKRMLHKLMRNATKPALTRPVQKFSTTIVTTRKPLSLPTTDWK